MNRKEMFNKANIQYLINNIKIDCFNIKHEVIQDKLNKISVQEEILLQYDKINITGAILVKNQEEKINDAILSIKSLCDQIYVFDTGSTDNTIKNIQEKSNSVIIQHVNWKEDYSYMRNYVDQHTPDGWLLILDSDEVLLSDTIKSVEFLRFELAVFSFFIDQQDIAIRFRQVFKEDDEVNWPTRLYKKSSFTDFFGYVHEELRSKRDIIYILSTMTVLNTGTSSDEIKKFDKENRYYNLLKKNIEIEKDNMQWYALLPFDREIKENTDWYISKLERFANMILSGELHSSFNERLLINYIKSLMSQYELQHATTISKKALSLYPDNPYLLYLKYTSEIGVVENYIVELVNSFKEDTHLLKNKRKGSEQWTSYNTLDLLPDIMVKLLTKGEFYDYADELISHIDTKVGNHHLIEPEIQLFNKK